MHPSIKVLEELITKDSTGDTLASPPTIIIRVVFRRKRKYPPGVETSNVSNSSIRPLRKK